MKVISNIKLNKNKSIFAVSEGERKIFNSFSDNTSNIGEISNIDLKILKILNKFFCLTLKQFSIMLNVSIDSLENKLKILENIKVISSCTILNKKNTPILKFYFIDKIGKKLLENKKIIIEDFNIRECNIIQLKKILKWNDILISMIYNTHTITGYNNNIDVFSASYNKRFRINGGYIKLENDIPHYMFEIVREEKDLNKKILKRIRAYSDFYSSYKTENFKIKEPPKLVLVCEDDAQALTILNEILINGFNKNIFCFSTDLRISNFELLNFNLDTKESICMISSSRLI